MKNREKRDIHDVVREIAIKSLYLEGVITEEDLKDKDVLKAKLKEVIDKVDFKIVIEYKDDLIKNARFYRLKNDFNNSNLFYAMFFEHSLNELIINFCSKNEIDKKTANDIIKSTSIAAKMTWLPRLLKLPNINDKHRKVIMRVAEDRNAYVHYKYPYDSDNDTDDQDEKIEIQFVEIEKTVTYFKRYTSKIRFNNKKGHIEKIIN